MRERLRRRLRLAPRSPDEPRAGRARVTALVLVLLLATAAAFGFTERLKLERSPVTAPQLERVLAPACDCPRETVDLAVTLRRPDRLDVAIVDMDGEHVRTLATAVQRPRGVARFRWDGRDDAGEVVADGRYRLRLALADADRTIDVPAPIRVDATAPRIHLVSATPSVFSPEARGKAGRVTIVYRATERSYALVYVDGKAVARSIRRPAGTGRVAWRGRLRGEIAPPGRYSVWLTAVDGVGNESEPTPPVTVRVQ